MYRVRHYLLLLFFLGVFYLILTFGIQESYNITRSWLDPVVTGGEVTAARWMRDNIPERAIVNGGIFTGEMFMAVSGVRTSVGGDWFLINDSAEWMMDCEKIYTSVSSRDAYERAVKRNISYIFVSPPERKIHCGYGWKAIKREKFRDKRFFRLVYDRDGVEIYRVKGVREASWPLPK